MSGRHVEWFRYFISHVLCLEVKVLILTIAERPAQTRVMELPPFQVEELSNTNLLAETCQRRNYTFPAHLFGEGKKGKKQKEYFKKIGFRSALYCIMT